MTHPGLMGAAELLEAAESLSISRRTTVLEAMAGFQVDPLVWHELTPAVVNLAVGAQPNSLDEHALATVAAVLPLDPAVRPHEWTLIAEQNRVSVEQWIDHLHTELAGNPTGPAVEELACLPIENYDIVLPSDFGTAAARDSDDVRLWAAIAIGRLGEYGPIDSVLEDLKHDRSAPPLLGEDPVIAYGRLARARPLPTPLRSHLLDSSRHQRTDLLVHALTDPDDPEADPIAVAVEYTAPQDDASAPPDPQAVAETLLEPNALHAPLWVEQTDYAWRSALSQFDPDIAGRVVANLINLAADASSESIAGERIVRVVSALPPDYRLQTRDVLAGYLSRPSGLTAEQLAFALARADLDDVLTGFAETVRAAPDDAEQSSVLNLLDQVAQVAQITGRSGSTAPGSPIPFRRVAIDTALIPRRDYGAGLRAPLIIGDIYGVDPDAQGLDFGGPDIADTGVDAEPPSRRRLRADVYLTGGVVDAPSTAFTRGERHEIQVWIGHQRDAGPKNIEADQDIPESAVHRDPGRFTELRVAFVHAGVPQEANLYLPNDPEKSSTPCTFMLNVGADQAEVSAMIILSQNLRTLQQFSLTGRTIAIGTDPTDEHRIALVAEVVARSIENAGAGSDFDVSVNRSADGQTCVLTRDKPASVPAPWDEGIRKTVDFIADRIFAAEKNIANGGGDIAWLGLIRTLAAQGALLRAWLQGQDHYEDLSTAGRIQLTDASPTRPLPIELVYDGPAAADDAGLCPNWNSALDTGECESCSVAADNDQSSTICPLGFWGLRKVIERQTGKSEELPGKLHLLAKVLVAASERVSDDDVNSVIRELDTALGNEPARAHTWLEWSEQVQALQPSLIVALPHQELDPNLDVDVLEIGGDQLRPGGVGEGHVKSPYGPAAVVLLLGCRTANATVTYLNFVSEFRSNGAPIVLGTLSSILGRDAAAIVKEFIQQLATKRLPDTEAPAIPFAETMRTIRRLMVKQKNAGALGVLAFGDGDWQLEVNF